MKMFLNEIIEYLQSVNFELFNNFFFILFISFKIK